MSLPRAITSALLLDTSRPLVTWYDDATGERVELSVATTANWVAKTANLLRDSLDVQPDDRVVVSLPRHWQTPVVHLATWLAGACVVAVPPGSELPPGSAYFVAESALDAGVVVPRGVEVVALSLRPMGARLAQPRPGVLDFAVEAPGHGDDFAVGPAPTGPAAVVSGESLSPQDLLDRFAALELAAGVRTLVRYEPWTLPGLLAGSLAPLLAGAGVLICAGTDDVPQSRLDAERVTRTFG